MSEMGEEVLPTLVENVTEAAKNATTKIPATPQGMAMAYGSLVVMSLLPIFLGSFRSITHQIKQKKSGEKVDIMTSKDAALFPIIASSALLGLYVVFTVFPIEYVNLLLSSYFFVLGISALTHVFSPFISGLIPSFVPLESYHFVITKGSGEKPESILDYKCTTHDFIAMIVCFFVALWYVINKHWIANDLLGLSFAITGVEMLQLNTFQTGALLLGGLFIYDIFWVFGTNVMVTVAKSFDAPIKLVFPQDLFENGLSAKNFALLGLGDIVIPGIFIALLLRFDRSLNRGSNTYFNVTFGAYLAGLLTTIFVMHVFKAAQPALLYLVPACLGAPTLVALIKGDFKALIKYEDNPNEEESSVDTSTDDKKEK